MVTPVASDPVLDRPDAPGDRPDGDGGPVLPEPLLELTDEETAVVFDDNPMVATPFLGQVPDDARALVLHTAYRSLVAHEVLREPEPHRGEDRPTDEEGVEGEQPREVELSEGLAAVMDIRRGAPVLLCLQRAVADEIVLRYAHVVGDFVLVEDVLATGLHRFGWLERADLRRCLQDFLVPDDATGGPEDPDELVLGGDAAEAPPWLVELVAGATVVVDVTVRHAVDDGPGDLVGLFLGPAGSWCTRAAFGAPGPTRFVPLHPHTVGGLVTGLVAEAEALVEAALGPELSSLRDPVASSP